MTFRATMAEALRRTQLGDLRSATALIRATLDGGTSSGPTVSAATIAIGPEYAEAGLGRGEAAAEDCRFEARRHVAPTGQLDYMLYRPRVTLPGMPLVVMLHGCTQSPEDFALGTGMNRLADERGILVAYPRQAQVSNQARCWNWFRPGDQERGRGEPALIAGVTRDVIEVEGVDTTRVYVAGLSAGGATAAIMADAYPDLFAAVGVHSGLACGAARNLSGALSAMKRGSAYAGKRRLDDRFVPLVTFHGDRDGTVHEANARGLVAAATAAVGAPVGVEVETGAVGGRRYARALSRDKHGKVLIEQWTVSGAGHAWSGGDPAGSHTDAAGPNASREMLRFFLEQRLAD
ncbi:PHB depolymerase family esterase [Sphingomonas yunnanensis]|uniref:extracellular catalytic domain type 1 short-chain-length polyhydroxyalkanoate depolymerase n=1 Tax=Sphingomonas yunnanensis TaxID=310400 RepID=UPI001CA793DE|nr:PHB depolymerase family esterase [Sphingomonas yunnanensis]MBY9063622.1 PHB depolymerase family esterase [Sphingomonas yunnanensis]